MGVGGEVVDLDAIMRDLRADAANPLARIRHGAYIADGLALAAEVERLRDADAVLTRWGRLRAEYAALRGRQDHAPTHEEQVAAWARMDALEAEIEVAFRAVRLASDARGVRSIENGASKPKTV